MSSNIYFSNIEFPSLSSIKESFSNLKEEESAPIDPKDYLFSFETRTNMINWLVFLCNTLNFTNETLFRTISIFDQYCSKISINEIKEMTQDNLNLITIASLSLSTKLEENNCNFISFLNDKVLNSPERKVFTNNDLTKMELKILKALKYKTIYSTPLNFIEIYLKILFNYLKKNNLLKIPEILSNIRTLSINLIKNNINTDNYLFNSASHFSYLCFIQALNQFSIMNSTNFKQLEKSIFIFNYQLGNVV